MTPKVGYACGIHSTNPHVHPDFKGMKIEEWQQELETAFTDSKGVFAPHYVIARATTASNSESLLRQANGFRVLLHSFIHHCRDTLERTCAAVCHSPLEHPRRDCLQLADLIAAYRQLLAADEILWSGQDSPASSHVRGIIEVLTYHAGAAHGLYTIDNRLDVPTNDEKTGEPLSNEQRLAHGKRLQDRLSGMALKRLLGSLSKVDQDELACLHWNLCADIHHLSVVSTRVAMQMFNNLGFTVDPPVDIDRFGRTALHLGLACWMLNRCLACSPHAPVDDVAWRKQYKLIDTSFQYFFEHVNQKQRAFASAACNLMKDQMNVPAHQLI